ncbi:hypothetical protein B0H15DRAFT_949377 [Mycena belliarum]|uniref:Uncharacterized protein n=1 Tax=Mycena belliarum TaxID=1033014 RepID=A0AAD6U4W3_9AGAR|nr:hypothetical protein B0H15DRAFT_949377 [Mycena belliae]
MPARSVITTIAPRHANCGTQAHPTPVGAPLNSNGPQCAHCGWRGGSHASNCPFIFTLPLARNTSI